MEAAAVRLVDETVAQARVGIENILVVALREWKKRQPVCTDGMFGFFIVFFFCTYFA